MKINITRISVPSQALPAMPTPRGVLLGIDHGDKVIGLAACDASWVVARPLGLLERRTRAEDFAAISALVTKHRAVGVVVGLPQTPPNFDGVSQADTVARWVSRLAAALEAPVYTWDETLSTAIAEEITAEMGQPVTGRLDDRAAAVILQSFIDAHPHGTPLPRSVKLRP
jgi:putative Holliday junction resolvase